MKKYNKVLIIVFGISIFVALLGLIIISQRTKTEIKFSPLASNPTPSIQQTFTIEQWGNFSSDEGFAFSYPKNWFIFEDEIDHTGHKAYGVSSIQSSRVRNLQAKFNMEFRIENVNFDEEKEDYIKYYNRDPNWENASTYLFFGDAPAQFTQEAALIDNHPATKFTISEASWEQEGVMSSIIIKLSSSKVLKIRRNYTDADLTAEELSSYQEIYNKIIQSLEIH